MSGRRNWRERSGELISSSMVCFLPPIYFEHFSEHVADDAHAARRRYKKDLDQIKPDLEAYNAQKAIAMGLNPAGSSSALTAFSSTDVASTSAVRAITSEEQRLAAENLYRDANSLIYGDNKPSEDAIDRVVGKINKECVSFISCVANMVLTWPRQYRKEGQVPQEEAQRGGRRYHLHQRAQQGVQQEGQWYLG